MEKRKSRENNSVLFQKTNQPNPSLQTQDLFNDTGEKFTENHLWNSVYFMEDELKKPINLYHHILFRSNMVTGATLCFKKEIEKFLILPIPTVKKFYHDEWIAIIIASRNKLGYLTDKLISLQNSFWTTNWH